MAQYHFVFCFLGECCQRPHLYNISKFGKDRSHALKKALKLAREGGKDVSEVVSVSAPAGPVCEVEEG
jgi:hypothetical protein